VAFSRVSPSLRILCAATGVAALAIVGGAAARGHGPVVFAACAALGIAAGVAYLVWQADPAWSLSAGLLLSPFAGNWDQMGLPTTLAPDRFVLLIALAAILLRAPGSRTRPPLRLRPVHWVLAVAIAYVAASAAASGTLLKTSSLAQLVENFGVIPFLLFLCAPAAFRSERQRRVLLAALVILGAYLGLVALLETLGADSLIYPRYITNPNVGILPNRARGPFVEPATFGVALFTCAAACVVAWRAWPRAHIRLALVAIGLLCSAGLLFTLTRQVWVASMAAVVLVAIAVRPFRRYLLPAAVVGAAGTALLLATVPGLSAKASERRNQEGTVWDRLNLDHAAINAIEDRPLFGVGWDSWTKKNLDYFELNPNYPLTAVADGPVHNVFLAYGAQIGLIGLTLWVAGMLIGVGGTLMRRGPPEIQPWRAFLLGVFAFFVVVANFEFVQVFPNLIVWLLAGVVAAPAFWLERDVARPSPVPAGDAGRRELGLAAGRS
jgi:putative inorganic carbon (hco3(-)) transporter